MGKKIKPLPVPGREDCIFGEERGTFQIKMDYIGETKSTKAMYIRETFHKLKHTHISIISRKHDCVFVERNSN